MPSPLADAIKALRIKTGSHDKLVAVLKEHGHARATRQLVIDWEKGAVPGPRYKEALVGLGVPADRWPPETRPTVEVVSDIEERLRRLELTLSQSTSYELSLSGQMIERAIADPAAAQQMLPEWRQLADVYARWAEALRDLVERLEQDEQSNTP